LEAGEMSVRRMSRKSGISRRCLTEWKNRKGELEGAHGARCRLHGRGRSSWYRDMEAEVYRRFLAHRKKCLAVSIARLQKWSHEVMKELHPGEKWAGSQRWTQRFRRRWNLTTRAKTRVGQKLSSTKTYTARLGERILWDLHEDRDVYNEMWQIPVVPMPKERQVAASISTEGEAVGSGDGANGRAKEIKSKKCNLGGTSKLGEHEESGAAAKKQHKDEENPMAAAEEEYGENMWGTIASEEPELEESRWQAR
ncbi:unnamed protein product, partial [Closterium sp. NIES-53]